MTVARAQGAPTASDRGPSAPRHALGLAVHRRSDEVAERSLDHLAHSGVSSVCDVDMWSATYGMCLLATQLIGRWLLDNVPATEAERDEVAGLGTFDELLPVADLVSTYLTWREEMLRVIAEEAEVLALTPELVRMAEAVVSRSCDSALVRMATRFDQRRKDLESALASERAKLTHQASHDALTGLANRAHFSQQLEAAVQSALTRGQRVGVLFIDLDGFKAVNDTRGHEAGDRLLQTMAARLQEVVRPSDLVARLGGDEFVVLCRDLRDAEAESARVAARLLAALVRPCRVGSGEVTISASIGIAVAPAAATPDTLLAHADAAMYAAKQAGGSRVEVWHP